ncbi:MAG: pimeloyl-[acyl-carrier protein] methyl ester esterase, partial [Thiogranum sp.]|nr:pimeloyl-[acyl-carrier protein] methyl ester esterase [Thiogranum sp.]
GAVLRRLRAQLGSRRQASPQALQAGLDMLRQSDQRAVLQRLIMPVYGIFGERDRLVPALIADTLPEGDSLVIEGAGHAPFLSHARQCADQLQQWLLTPSERRHAAN